jgi:hypothetical protein
MGIDESLPKVASKREVKSFIVSRETSSVFAINARPDGLCRLTIRHLLDRLQDCDQRQTPRRLCRTPSFGEEIGNHLIGRDPFQFIS